MRTKQSQRLTLVQGGAGQENNGSASTIYGCESHASTTLQAISREVQLSELLNDLERQVQILEYKYSEVLDTWLTATTHLVRLLPSIIDEDTTNV